MSRRPNKQSNSHTQNEHFKHLISTNQNPPRGGGSSLHMTTFDNAPFWQSTSIFASVNFVGFLISLATGSHLHLDLLGSGAFALAALPPLVGKMAGAAGGGTGALLTRVKWSSIAVVVWGAKLAGFLFFRALKVKHDARLDETLSTVGGTFAFWLCSFLWGVFSALPHTMGTTSSSPGDSTTLHLGTVLYTLGLLTETIADFQKWTFKSTHPGQFCNVGLWSLSQHPNFFGNIVLWSGVFVMNVSALNGPRAVIAALSPIVLVPWFWGQANGSVTNAVELANAKYGKDKAYLEYVKTVPLLVPSLGKLFGGK